MRLKKKLFKNSMAPKNSGCLGITNFKPKISPLYTLGKSPGTNPHASGAITIFKTKTAIFKSFFYRNQAFSNLNHQQPCFNPNVYTLGLCRLHHYLTLSSVEIQIPYWNMGLQPENSQIVLPTNLLEIYGY